MEIGEFVQRKTGGPTMQIVKSHLADPKDKESVRFHCQFRDDKGAVVATVATPDELMVVTAETPAAPLQPVFVEPKVEPEKTEPEPTTTEPVVESPTPPESPEKTATAPTSPQAP